MLGFHTSFYHSWRGDTPDEAGFGTDIRLVRAILQTLNDANARGLHARGYWDFDNYWTLERIIPQWAPDIITAVRARVQCGQDEVVPGPYNNGANHAATEAEFRTAVRWALENPFGSGLKQLFGQVTPIYRPQEGMYTAGQNRILLEEGYQGIILYYSAIPFNSISTFIPALPPVQRYNPLRLRSQPGEAPIILLPAISPGDLADNVSLEALMLDLHRLQVSGQVRSDLLIHLNFDADSDTWMPAGVPRAFAWFPNTGGLEEYIRAVNRYPWAEFTTPLEYLAGHPPQGEVLVQQDLADGAFDGSYSWAEKLSSMEIWSRLENSRLHSLRAGFLNGGGEQAPGEDQASPAFQRLVGLSTTHFGMSTPVINEERQAKARALLEVAEAGAVAEERAAAEAVASVQAVDTAQDNDPLPPGDSLSGEEAPLYVFHAYNFPRLGQEASAGRFPVRLPLLLPSEIAGVRLVDESGRALPASLVDKDSLPGGQVSADLLFADAFGPQEARTYRVYADGHAADGQVGGGSPPLRTLKNDWLELHLGEKNGVEALVFQGREIGGPGFLEPFITYRSDREPQTWMPDGYTLAGLPDESWDGLARARLEARLPMDTPDGQTASRFTYTFTLLDHLPYLLVDVEAEYAFTTPKDAVRSLQQKLRRLLDLRWIEAAPFQLTPALKPPAGQPLRIWKHNYLGITSYYDLNYGQVNPRNRELDSFNHQATAGWVAVSDGRTGLLLGENAARLSSMAFSPMRLREEGGEQRLSLNPFGSYYGKQPDYSHLGASGLGAEFTLAVSGALKPNGPSFNGQRQSFSLLLAPYAGDAPPEALQAAALAHFYPIGVIYLQTPEGVSARLPEDLRRQAAGAERQARLERGEPLAAPAAFLANPSDGQAVLVWEARDNRASGYEVRWREAAAVQWNIQSIPPVNRWEVSGLRNGVEYRFQARALAGEKVSGWTPESRCTPGPVEGLSLISTLPGVPTWTLARLVFYSLRQALFHW